MPVHETNLFLSLERPLARIEQLYKNVIRWGGRAREDDILMIGPGGAKGENPYLGYLPDILHDEGVLSYMRTIPTTGNSLVFYPHLFD